MAMKVIINDILDIINNNIKNTNIMHDQLDEDLSKHGMDSLIFINIVVALKETFEIDYPDEYLSIIEPNTLNKLVSIVSEALEKKNVEGAKE